MANDEVWLVVQSDVVYGVVWCDMGYNGMVCCCVVLQGVGMTDEVWCGV